MYFLKMKNVFVQTFPGILFPAGAGALQPLWTEWNTKVLSKIKVFLQNKKKGFVHTFPGILFPAGAGAAIMDRVKYEPIMAPTSTTCRQADQKPLQGKPNMQEKDRKWKWNVSQLWKWNRS